MTKKEFFNQMAYIWDEKFYSKELFRRLDEMVATFGFCRGDCILDVGCGTGGLIPSLLKVIGPYGRIYSVDFAEEMVKKAKKKFKSNTNIHIMIAPIENLPFNDAFFDHVVCFGSFPHFEGKEEALGEMYRVLQKGGKLFIAHVLSSEEIKSHHKGVTPVANDILPEEPKMNKMMDDAGFKKVNIIDKEKCYICQGEKE